MKGSLKRHSKGERGKKRYRVRITDDIWTLAFRNQTKGPRWKCVPRDHLFPASFPGSKSLRSSDNTILLVRDDPEMTPEGIKHIHRGNAMSASMSAVVQLGISL